MRTFIHLISSVCCGIAAALILISCSGMSQEENEIKNYLNGKLSARAAKAEKVEIISQDTVLSLLPMDGMYNRCRVNDDIENLTELNVYFLAALEIRDAQQMETQKNAELLAKYKKYLRRIMLVKVTAEDGHVTDGVEVIYDAAGKPQTVGTEYDFDLEMWDRKIRALRGY